MKTKTETIWRIRRVDTDTILPFDVFRDEPEELKRLRARLEELREREPGVEFRAVKITTTRREYIEV